MAPFAELSAVSIDMHLKLEKFNKEQKNDHRTWRLMIAMLIYKI